MRLNLLASKIARAGKRKAAWGRTQEAQRVIEEFLAWIKAEAWRKGRLVVPGFAVFTVKTSKARKIANPITGAEMLLPRQKAMKARVSKEWRTR